MENNSDKSVKFGFNKPNANNNEQDVKQSSVENKEESVIQTKGESEPQPQEDLDLEYTDKRSITINLVKNHSLYRKANAKALPKRNDYIGSSITSSRTLSSNKEEVETYFPNIIGLAPNNPDFVTRVKQYLNNIKIAVDELGKTFDITFRYYHKKDYLRIKKEEDRIEEEFKRVNRQDINEIKKALKIKIDKLNVLESSKCKLGYPLNVEDYIMYRHCLLYKDVAKDLAIINSDSSIRFYIKDDQKETEKLRKHMLEIRKAKANYVECLADPKKFEAVYVLYCSHTNRPILSSLAEDDLTKEINLDKFSSENPVLFNKLVKNPDINIISTIEQLIARGELYRSEYNQNITTSEGNLIGANMNEAVIWFKNPDNASYVNAYRNKLNNI